MAQRVEQDPASILGDFALSDSDRAVLGRADLARVIRESTRELVHGGHWGWVDDDLAFTRPWGFALEEIAVPVEVRYGEQDVLVPAAHGGWLAANVPGATVVVESGHGHMRDLDEVVELTRWLVTGRYGS